MKRLLLLPLLLAAFLLACSSPEPQEAGKKWFVMTMGEGDTASMSCEALSPDYNIRQWQKSTLENFPTGSPTEKCQSFIRSLQDFNKESLVDSAVIEYETEKALGVVCFRDSASKKTALVPILIESSGKDVTLVDIAPQRSIDNPSDTSWQPSPEVSKAAEKIKKRLPKQCQGAEVFLR